MKTNRLPAWPNYFCPACREGLEVRWTGGETAVVHHGASPCVHGGKQWMMKAQVANAIVIDDELMEGYPV